MTFQYYKKLPAELTRSATLLRKFTVLWSYYHHYFILFLGGDFSANVSSVFMNSVEYKLY